MSKAASMRKHLPDADHFLGVVLPEFPNHRITETIGSGCNGHVYRAHSEEIESDLAFKFVPIENLPSDPEEHRAYLMEAKKANSLENECVVRCVDVLSFNDDGLQKDFVVFVCQYVSGVSLKRFMQKDRDSITVAFIESFLNTMFGLLYELKQRDMEHGDLHSGNVLVSRSKFDLSERTTFKVTDFGISEVTGMEHQNDYLFVAQVLRDLLAKIDYQELMSRDRYVYDVLRLEFLDRHLIETDSLADPFARNPEELNSKLNAVDDDYLRANREHTSNKMVTPFDYPNCEQMGSSHLLLKNLYSDRLLGLSEIRARSNLVLTGPRGCGKTTVFRALSLDYMTSVDDDMPDEVDFVGVYYRCDDLYFSFPRYELPSRPEAIDIPMHFVIVSLLAETLRHLSEWANRHFGAEFRKKEPDVVARIWDICGLSAPSGPTSDRFAPLIAKLMKQRARAANKQRVCHVPAQPIEGYVGPSALFQCCTLLRQTFSFLANRPFFFFIDDYSTPKITSALQKNLNRLLMHRNPDAFFKLSTESPISFERGDIDGKQYVEEREFDLLNLGLRYLHHEGEQVQTFLSDLFGRRFNEVSEFPCDSLDQLLGDYPRNENETARLFREKKGRNSFCGVQTVTAMCSGDIHYMIRLVGRMVEDVGGSEYMKSNPGAPLIPRNRQSNTIRSAAGEFMESVRTLPRHGDTLAAIVSALANVSGSYMRYCNAVNVTGNPPHQASRIEPYEPLRLSDKAQSLLNELVRFSIFLMDPRGKSRRGEVVPRFYLRRYLIPHFNLTFSRRDSLELENREIELLLLDPRKFQELKRIKSTEDPRVKKWRDRNQGDLFQETGDER